MDTFLKKTAMGKDYRKCSAAELRAKFKTLITKADKFNSVSTPAWNVAVINGRSVLRVNRACSLDRGDLNLAMKSVREGRCVGSKRPCSEILSDLIKAVKELEDMRDVEWEFADEHGTDASYWTENEEKDHQWIIDSIQAYRENVQRLAREATGDENVEI